MSGSRVQSSEHEQTTYDEPSEPLAPELAVSSSRELSSNSLSNPKAISSSPRGIETYSTGSELRRTLSPSAFSLSKSRSPSDPRSQSNEHSSISSPGTSSSILPNDGDQTIRHIIVRSFAPRVAVYASTDTEDFVKGKGFKEGLHGLVRPYGERLQGKVIIRDGVGGSKAWDDFGVRLLGSQQLNQSGTNHSTLEALDPDSRSQVNGNPGTAIDQVLDHFLQRNDGGMGGYGDDYFDLGSRPQESQPDLSPSYPRYLRKLLSNASLVPYETFSHPVACMIAVSSHHPAPIEALRQLYVSTGQGSNQSPAWVGTEYLRYYVLIHDEEKDDITKSTALFDLMKCHFGLHCHLLRLRGSQCVQTDDDSSKVPQCEWLSAEEEIDHIRKRGYTDDLEVAENYIPESDVTAIRAFLREMVTQSIVPFMENRVVTWNDQVASRRRGISGRFMSLSKRWTSFGSSKHAATGSSTAANSSGSNYDHQRGFYPPETPEATMRQLGDYAFMLRDYRLAYSTYDFLRTDFNHDKAWAYHAASNEMSAITSLLIPQTLGSKSRSENVDQMLDTAAYSYLTRCSMPKNVVRCLTLATELLKSRGPVAVDDAARWGGKLLELGVLSSFAQTLMTERLADCYASRNNATAPFPRARKRQAALWNLLASESWVRLDRSAQARFRFQLATELYEHDGQANKVTPFASMQLLWHRLGNGLHNEALNESLALIDLGNSDSLDNSPYQESEQLNTITKSEYVTQPETADFTPQGAGRSDAIGSGGSGLLSDGFE